VSGMLTLVLLLLGGMILGELAAMVTWLCRR
jgi:hypothetical protein